MLHQIGIGALGPVFRTYEPTRDRLVAVKVFRLDIVPEQAQALATALHRATEASLFHPSIVEPIAAGVEGTVAYRAEEYVAAESLDVAMRHYAPAAVEKALPFITQLAGAIDFARAAGVGHGGLHPRDIFVTPDEARATGFGVIDALDEVGIRAPVRRPYTAPERIEGRKWSTPADVFSLAAIAFELLTGRRPAGIGAQIGALPDGPHAAALHAVLARGMDEDPAKRYATALAFAAALEAAARGEGVSAAPPPAASAPAAPAQASASRPVSAPVPIVAPTPPVTSASTPGELKIEKDLDPVLTAIDDEIADERQVDEPDYAERSLFDEPRLGERPRPRESAADAFANLNDAEAERFADDFNDFEREQEAEAEARRPLEAVHESIAPVIAPEARMFSADDSAERSRPVILPIAVTLVIGLLGGFGAAYYLLSRDAADVPATSSAPVTQPASPSAAGPATAEKPGQYSEQKVTSTPPAAAPPTAAPPTIPPPVPNETAAARGATGARRGETAITRGRLVVTSTPSRASVTVNGTWRGRTPLTLENLPFGRYVIRVVQPGYEVARQEVTLSARGASRELSARLDRAASPTRSSIPTVPPRTAAPAPSSPTTESFTGSLFVDSRPRGATVFVDDRSVGQTPLSLPGVPVGSHVVRLEMTGKKTWTTLTRVVAGQTARVTGSLDDKQ